MQASFLLRKEKKTVEGLIPIQIVISFNGIRIRKNVPNAKTLIKDWKNNRIKPNLKSEP